MNINDSSRQYADEMENALDEHLHLLRADLQQLDAPPETERALMHAFAAQYDKQDKTDQARKPRWQPWLAGLLTLGGSLGLFMFNVILPMSPAKLPAEIHHTAAVNPPPFIALVPLERLDEGTPHMMETEVPAAWLASLGMPVSPEIAGEMVQAQMLVDAEGSPLAMRLLKN
ncbi:hypothetical protein [Undibacterium sp. TS12]|uniref:hypothetical protein n=1 Tax=Undibacterium sp. TS12 TaxID=2908202 RepID=UPI001F4CE089|nr:hypothetical protein [Undibacterium sp. TS12]MCH8618668.1 hypothetical protein [Undibacterium sp. TS12]